MNLYCVMPITRISDQVEENAPRPGVMDHVIVLQEFVHPRTGRTYYQLVGYPARLVYSAECFAIVPDDTADEVDAREKEAIIYQR